MKTAEREINRVGYAFTMLSPAKEEVKSDLRGVQGKSERVLIINVFNERYEAWHPILGEFSVQGGGGGKGKYKK